MSNQTAPYKLTAEMHNDPANLLIQGPKVRWTESKTFPLDFATIVEMLNVAYAEGKKEGAAQALSDDLGTLLTAGFTDAALLICETKH